MSRKYLDLIALLNKRLNHFPAHEQKGLVPVIRQKMYLLCDHLVETQKRHHKMTPINNLDIAHQQLRMHLFAAYREGYFTHPIPNGDSRSEAQINQDRYDTLTILVDDFGKMIGGWKNKVIADDEKRKEKTKGATGPAG